MPRTESVKGNRIYERVQELLTTSDPKPTQRQAFATVAEDTGDKPGTVAANYYRIARQRSAANAAARRARSAERKQQNAERGMEPQPRRKAIDRDGQIADSLDEMAQVLHRQIDTLVQQYKAEHERLTRVRELVGG